MRQPAATVILCLCAIIATVGCGGHNGSSARPTGTPSTVAPQAREQCANAYRALRDAEEAYFGENVRYADETTLVEGRVLAAESPLYDISVTQEPPTYSIRVANPLCGVVGQPG